MKHSAILMIATLAMAGCNSSEEVIYPDGDDSSLAVEVIDYNPAPGQFVNVLPEWTEGMTAADMCRAVEKSFAEGREVTLGAWGGSLTVRLLQPIDGNARIKVLGNAITTGSEPGFVYVMADTNGNGKPDDGDWLLVRPENYDLAKQVTATYSRPADNATDEQYIAWTCSDGTAGYLNRVVQYHTQPFFPCWNNAERLTFSGLRLPDNGHFDESKMMYILDPVIGTADSFLNYSANAILDLGDLVDLSGRPATTARVDFIKVVTGVLQANGPLGECSTEVCGFEIVTP